MATGAPRPSIPTTRVFFACLRGDSEHKDFESALSQPGSGPFPWRFPSQRMFLSLQGAAQSVKVRAAKGANFDESHGFPRYFVARADIPRSRIFDVVPSGHQALFRSSEEGRDEIALEAVGSANCFAIEFSLADVLRVVDVSAASAPAAGDGGDAPEVSVPTAGEVSAASAPAAGEAGDPMRGFPRWRSVIRWRADIAAAQMSGKRRRLENSVQEAASLVDSRLAGLELAAQYLADVRAELQGLV